VHTHNGQHTHPHIAILGSGPSGFYTAKYLLEKHPTVRVDVYEKMPVPFGLVRYGVAPDHQEVKAVQITFTQVANNPRFRFFGNVEVLKEGADVPSSPFPGYASATKSSTVSVSVSELKKHYTGIVLACGAESDRSLNIPNEDCPGVLSARSFVNWYNGHPDYVSVGDTFDLSKVSSVVIIGNGNVAIDCARILAKTAEALGDTDISEYAREKLKTSNVRSIHVIGRRGVVQAACK
jgi:adrenodoxin-NADP+ reductase